MDNEIKFTCPDCGGNMLGQLQNVMTTYEITRIGKDGMLEYNHYSPKTGEGQVLSHQCMDCGYELRDESGNPVDDIQDVFDAVQKLNSKN